MVITPGKLASLVVAAIYVFAALVALGPGAALGCGVALLLPLALIWFPDELGNYTGGGGRGHDIDMESPEWAVAGLGWIFLLGGPAVGIWLASRY
jgi:membrane protease YdiL (CAAX protease family)